MLPEIINFKENETITLVSNSGIQFLDFGFCLNKNEEDGLIAILDHKQPTLLAEDDAGDFFYSINEETSNDNKIKVPAPHYELDTKESLTLLNNHWLPLPFLRYNKSRHEDGPTNWARIRFIELVEPDLDGNTHRITVAFDTRLMPHNAHMTYLAPTEEDVAAPAIFKMALKLNEVKWFFDQEWVSEWLQEIFIQFYSEEDAADLKQDLEEKRHIAHYLNILKLVSPIANHSNTHQPKLALPQVKLIDPTGKNKTVTKVDLILDIGNSRTCGILVENQAQSSNGLMHNYLLQLRDLTHPERVYTEPFESRVEFTQTSFENGNFSRQSGRMDAFLWPTFVRIGKEANDLASSRQGFEGSTGVSSPKRYLWDRNRYEHGWVFNRAKSLQTDVKAMSAPYALHINGEGEALYHFDEEERFSVLNPVYSRSSLTTFMLAEVIAQALNQMNSVAERIRQGHSDHARMLNSITLTVPPGMPLVERSILNERLQQAIALVWKCLGWHEGDDDPFADGGTPFLPLPKTHVEWDEASCGQLVYLYSEIANNFGNQPKAFFSTLAKADKADKNAITLATIDIGGGTTDLVITKYHLAGDDNSAHIVPTQLFRDGFKVAGDDILLDIIQQYILPSFANALQETGIKREEVDALLSKICGSESLGARERLLRQQLNLQLFTPLGLAILSLYERFDPNSDDKSSGRYTYRELLPQTTISTAVIEYVNTHLKRYNGTKITLLDTPIELNFKTIHQYFMNWQVGANIIKPLQAFSKVIFKYDCDMLLLTGRPSRLPGVQALLRQLMPLPPGRILPMHNYRTGSWYPFHKNQRIDDPKTTASVGALLCLLSTGSRIQNFNFRAIDLKPYSTIRHFGIINNENNIPKEDVIFHHIDTEKPEDPNSRKAEKMKLPEDHETGQAPPIIMRGALRLGFRQLEAADWGASPLYTLEFASEDAASRYHNAKVKNGLNDEMPVLKVTLEVKKVTARTSHNQVISDELVVKDVDSNTDSRFNRNDVKLELNTMLEAKSNQSNYWLDSGSVKI